MSEQPTNEPPTSEQPVSERLMSAQPLREQPLTPVEAVNLDSVHSGDLVIDAALQELREVPDDDLDGHLAAGQRLAATLHERLSDLGG